MEVAYTMSCDLLAELDSDELLRLRAQIDVELDRRRVPRNERHVLTEEERA